MAQILVVDDEVGIRDLLSEILSDEGYDVRLAENAGAARAFRSQNRPDLVLLDIWMPDTDGITLLKEWASTGQLTMPVVMMSGHGTIDTAVEATRIGAYDFLEKPIDEDILVDVLTHAISEDARGHQKRLQTETQLARINTLTQRERQVLTLLGRGLQNREIAIELSISPRTVEVYKARMMEKLDCSSIADVVKMSLLLDSPGHG